MLFSQVPHMIMLPRYWFHHAANDAHPFTKHCSIDEILDLLPGFNTGVQCHKNEFNRKPKLTLTEILYG